MKHILAGLLAVLLLLGLAMPGVQAEQAEGMVFLSVSKITFTLVGESEDIYLGTAPREGVDWKSDDEAVVTVADGVLTATGVGSTQVTATYGKQTVSCQVSCLAENNAKLKALENRVLRSPKRYPAQVDDSSLPFFQDAVLVGDSISYILYQNETMYGGLGHPKFLTRGGTSLNGFVLRYKNIYYEGSEVYLEDALAWTKKPRIFFMLGQNDLGYRSINETFESWDILLKRILDKYPQAEIYLQSVVPEWIAPPATNQKNETIDEYNIRLQQYAADHGYHFVDIAPYIEDHINQMATEYSLDNSIHLNAQGCDVWMQALRAYAYRIMNGGTQ